MHIALAASSVGVPAKAILTMMELEPRALSVRDLTSGCYPFIMAATKQWTVEMQEEREILDVVYFAFRADSNSQNNV